MVKTPNIRHSKPRKAPVTIDLEASRVAEDTPAVAPQEAESGTTAKAAEAESPQVAEASQAAADDTASARQESSAGTHSAGTQSSAFGRDAGGTTSARAASSARSSTPPPAAPAPRRGGVSALAAGIIGAIIALAGWGALQYAGILPGRPAAPGNEAALQALSQKVADLDARLESQAAAGVDSGAAAQAVADLTGRVDKLAADLDAARKAMETGGGADQAALAALQEKIAGIEGKLGEAGTSGDVAALKDAVASLDAAVKSAAEAANAGNGRIAALEQTVAALSAKVDAQASQPKIALSIAASALRAAIERGQPFAPELETLAAISPDLPQLAALRGYAEAGVARREDLVAEMDAAADAMIAAAKPVDGNAGYLDRLWESAASLVTVRPVGSVAGKGVPETAARMEVALKAGNLAGALAEYETLPDAAKQAGAAFAGKIKARLDVEKLADAAIAEAMKSV